MTVSRDIFLAILSMDSCNRWYDSGIADGESANDSNGLGEEGYQVGTATIQGIDLPANSQSAGFYAVAYDTGFATNGPTETLG
jgi:hypothetical protein